MKEKESMLATPLAVLIAKAIAVPIFESTNFRQITIAENFWYRV